MYKSIVHVSNIHESEVERDLKPAIRALAKRVKNLHPIEDAIVSVNKLLKSKYKIYFLSTAPWDNPDAWTHKRLWIAKHFEEKLIKKKLILCHHKQLLIGDYLIDDRKWNGASKFTGEWIHFGSKRFPKWKSVLEYLNVK